MRASKTKCPAGPLVALALTLLAASCSGGIVSPASESAGVSSPFGINVLSPPTVPSSGLRPILRVFTQNLSSPWGMAFLPDGKILVTQKGGTLVAVSHDGSAVSGPIAGVPPVDSRGQGGLLDVAIGPQFAKNRFVYLAYSEPGPGNTNGTAVARGRLDASASALSDTVVIFRQSPKKSGTAGHYGSRLVFRNDGTLFVTLGDRQRYASEAQSLTSQLGKIVRLYPDGTAPPDNPFYTRGGDTAAIWTYGHRNPQSAAIHPATGELWITEHGPQGGDEINLALPGRNFGWPAVSYGCPYGSLIGTACRIGGGTHTEPYTAPLAYWYPTSTAPGGMAFYTGERFPEWQGSLFVGGLAGETLWRFVLKGSAIVGVEPLFEGQHEIRDVRVGPDGWLYLLSRNQDRILRVER